MNRVIICGIPMKEKVDIVIYSSDDRSIPASSRRVRFPINAFLEETMKSGDNIRFLLLVKKDGYGHYKKNIDLFKEEFESVNAEIGASADYVVIDTEFSEERSVHEKLLGSIVDELEIGAHVVVDITYGPKDLPIVVFTALNFAEKFLECRIDSIIYGKAEFADGKVADSKICDMSPLYYLGSVTNTIHCAEPEKAKEMLKRLLSL